MKETNDGQNKSWREKKEGGGSFIEQWEKKVRRGS